MAPYYACVKCKKQMRCEKGGVFVIEMADFGPYKIWRADVWVCPDCRQETICGFGVAPLAEHYEDRFAKILEDAKASGRVYYC